MAESAFSFLHMELVQMALGAGGQRAERHLDELHVQEREGRLGHRRAICHSGDRARGGSVTMATAAEAAEAARAVLSWILMERVRRGRAWKPQ